MKKVGLALASAFLILVGSSAQAQEMPFGFGIKAGYLNPSFTGLKEAKSFEDKASQADLFNPSFNAGLYGEYAFHDYVGVGLEAYYSLTGGKFHKEGDNKKKEEGKKAEGAKASTSNGKMAIRIHQINAIPMLKIYPMGRNIDEAIFSIHFGPELILPLKGTYKIDDNQAKDIDKKDLTAFNIAGLAGLGVEFPFGLLLEARGSYGFMDAFTKEDAGFKKATLKVSGDTKNNPWYANISLGYNFARLLEE